MQHVSKLPFEVPILQCTLFLQLFLKNLVVINHTLLSHGGLTTHKNGWSLLASPQAISARSFWSMVAKLPTLIYMTEFGACWFSHAIQFWSASIRLAEEGWAIISEFQIMAETVLVLDIVSESCIKVPISALIGISLLNLRGSSPGTKSCNTE